MATITTIDKTTQEGSATYPLTANEVYKAVETLASQEINNVKSANVISDAYYDYQINNGKVIEEVVIEMAEAQAFDKTPKFVVKDPLLHVKYFNNYETKQFQATIRKDDIASVLTKEKSVEDVVGKVLDTLTQGESNYDFVQTRNVIFSANWKNYSTILGNKNPTSMKGVIYAIRDMYNHLKYNNKDLTGEEYISSVAEEDIRIALTDKLMNLIDVAELSHVLNLSKVELFGKLVIIPTDDLTDRSKDYIVYGYDRKAIGRATKVFDFTMDVYGSARASTTFLTVERAYFHNDLFKGAKLDCTSACNTELAKLLG